MTAEVKLRTLAQQDTTLQGYFFTDGQVRWFDRQLQPNYLKPGKTCARVTRVSTYRMSTHETKTQRSQNRMAQPLFQIDVLDYSAERARSAASAIMDWLATVDLSSTAQFSSPPTSPTRHPNQILNQRSSMEPRLQPPAYIESLDVRMFDLEQ